MSSEEEIFFNSRPDKTYASPAFRDYTGQKLRIATKVIDGELGYEFAQVSMAFSRAARSQLSDFFPGGYLHLAATSPKGF